MFNSKSQVFNNFLPQGIADTLHQYVEDIQWSYGWKSNVGMGYPHWHYSITETELRNGLDISENLPGPVNAAWQFIRSNVLQDYRLIRCYANGHTHGVEGYPHTDSDREHDITIVVYMNKLWKREWGGETVIYDGDMITLAAQPSFNRALVFRADQFHCARAVGRLCPDLRKTVMFKCTKNNVDVKRDQLQAFLNKIGATNKTHKRGSLTNHLLGTYDLLKKVGQPEHVCLAGGAHSVYGTNIFTESCLDKQDTAELLDIIGPTALRLVQLFESVDRPTVLNDAIETKNTTLMLTGGGTVQVTAEELYSLSVIEAANLQDQNGTVPTPKYANLHRLWVGLQQRKNGE